MYGCKYSNDCWFIKANNKYYNDEYILSVLQYNKYLLIKCQKDERQERSPRSVQRTHQDGGRDNK